MTRRRGERKGKVMSSANAPLRRAATDSSKGWADTGIAAGSVMRARPHRIVNEETP